MAARRGTGKSSRPRTSPAGYRSAKSGRYVTKSYGKKHPNTTVKETKRK